MHASLDAVLQSKEGTFARRNQRALHEDADPLSRQSICQPQKLTGLEAHDTTRSHAVEDDDDAAFPSFDSEGTRARASRSLAGAGKPGSSLVSHVL